MEDTILRMATKEDIEQLVDMRINYLKEVLDEYALSKAPELKHQLFDFFDKHLGLDVDAFVAEVKEEIVSTSFIVYYYRIPHPDFPTGTAGVPINGYTKPKYRNKGFAGTLLQKSAKYAASKGIEFLNMEVTKKGLSVCKGIGFNEVNYTPVQMKLK